MAEEVSRKKRSRNWTTKDANLLVEVYESFHPTIIGKLTKRLTAKMKEEAWTDLTKDFNSLVDAKRDIDEIKYKISNTKNDTRKYATALCRRKTGGGPKPPDPDAPIAKMYEIIYGSSGDSLAGIGSGMESGAGTAAAAAPSNDEEMDEDTDAINTLINLDVARSIADQGDSEDTAYEDDETTVSVVQKSSVSPKKPARRLW